MPLNRENKAICFLCHPYHRGGVTQWMIEAAAEYVRRGWETWFVTVQPMGFLSGKKRPTMWELLKPIDKLNLIAPKKSRSFELGTLKGRSLDYANSIYSKVPPGTPVILSDDESIWMAGKVISASYPVVGVLHSDDEVYYSLYLEYHDYLSGIVAVSERVKNKAMKLLKDNNIRVIPCGIRLPELLKGRKSDVLRLVWAGRIEERQKRVSDIPKIAKELQNTGIEFSWTIAGHGDEKSIKKELEALGILERFHFTGWIKQSELYSIMDESDQMILTSNFEGMPVAVMEAMSKGLGIVSSKVSGVEDLIKDDLATDAIRVYDIGDVDQAVNLIKEISKINEGKRVLASRKLAEKYYSIESCIDKYNAALINLNILPVAVPNNYIQISSSIEKIKSLFLSRLRYLKYKVTHQ